MSQYVERIWVNGEDFDATAANGWETRIDNLATAHEATAGGLATSVGTNTTNIAGLTTLSTTMPRKQVSQNTYTPQIVDAGHMIHWWGASPARSGNSAPKTLTLPPYSGGSGVAIPTDTVYGFTLYGTGLLTIDHSLVAYGAKGDADEVSGAFSVFFALKLDAADWLVYGDLA